MFSFHLFIIIILIIIIIIIIIIIVVVIVQARRFFQDLVKAVEYIHSIGVLHKDIKPANCMISSTGRLKVTDFGVAEEMSEVEKAREKAHAPNAVGSPAFQPPGMIDIDI